MPPLSLVKASNDAYCPPYVPVVVVFGGTSGIGLAMTRRLAEQLQGRIRIIVVARNEVAAKALFQSLPRYQALEGEDAEECGYEFISCDLNLMENVHRVAEEISKRCTKINYLVLSSGQAFFGRRQETEDGLEAQLAIRYYWKFAIINDLLPKLRAAKALKEAAGVHVPLHGNVDGPKIDFTDLRLERKHYLGAGPILWGVSYNDLMLSMYAEREPEIAFTNMYPGVVATEVYTPAAFNNYFFKLLMILIVPLKWLFFIKVTVSAENMVYAMLAGEKGFYQRNTRADIVGPQNIAYSEEDKQKFWDHSLKATRTVPR